MNQFQHYACGFYCIIIAELAVMNGRVVLPVLANLSACVLIACGIITARRAARR